MTKPPEFTPEELEWMEFMKWLRRPGVSATEAQNRLGALLEKDNQVAVKRVREMALLKRDPHSPPEPSFWATASAQTFNLVSGITNRAEFFGLWRDPAKKGAP